MCVCMCVCVCERERYHSLIMASHRGHCIWLNIVSLGEYLQKLYTQVKIVNKHNNFCRCKFLGLLDKNFY